MHKLEIDGLTKRYYVERDGRQVLALSDVSLSVADGEFMAIVGPSGCGKTTLLNIVAGLLRYDAGRVIIDGASVDGPGVDRAVVFQQASLLPWRTVAGNVRYGMELQKRFDHATMEARTALMVSSPYFSGAALADFSSSRRKATPLTERISPSSRMAPLRTSESSLPVRVRAVASRSASRTTASFSTFNRASKWGRYSAFRSWPSLMTVSSGTPGPHQHAARGRERGLGVAETQPREGIGRSVAGLPRRSTPLPTDAADHSLRSSPRARQPTPATRSRRSP